MSYIWQHEAWPNFFYDRAAVESDITTLYSKAGKLAGLRQATSKSDTPESLAAELADELTSSFAIEGETIEHSTIAESIVASLANHDLGTAAGNRYTPLAEMIIDAQDTSKPLTVDRLNDWHRKLFATNPLQADRGKLRTSEIKMVTTRRYEVVKVDYEGPPPQIVANEVDQLLIWLEHARTSKSPAPASAAIAHLWFESIHPYSDGNGRIGRALADNVLNQDPVFKSAPFSLSRILQRDREQYYEQLNHTQTLKGEKRIEDIQQLDVSQFVKWFIKAMSDGLDYSIAKARFLAERNNYFSEFGDLFNKRQKKVLERLFAEGPARVAQGISAGPYRRIAGCATATATRDLADLLSKGAIKATPSGGRSTRYEIPINRGLTYSAVKSRNIGAWVDKDDYVIDHDALVEADLEIAAEFEASAETEII